MNQRKVMIERGDRRIAAVVHEAGDGAPCVITCHGMFGDKDGEKYVAMGERFPAEGISVVRFDFSGCGESPGDIKKTTVGGRLADLEAVMDFAEEQLKPSSMGLLGSSLGGYVAILRAAEDPRVKALVVLATPYNLREVIKQGEEVSKDFWQDLEGRDLDEALKKLKVRMLIMHSEVDEVVPFSHAQWIYQNARRAKFRMIRGADHRFSHPTQREEVIEAALDWFRKYLR